jgi:hypothetical protein
VEVVLLATGSTITIVGFIALMAGQLQRWPELSGVLRASLLWIWPPVRRMDQVGTMHALPTHSTAGPLSTCVREEHDGCTKHL